jgi:hypothetical protein
MLVCGWNPRAKNGVENWPSGDVTLITNLRVAGPPAAAVAPGAPGGKGGDFARSSAESSVKMVKGAMEFTRCTSIICTSTKNSSSGQLRAEGKGGAMWAVRLYLSVVNGTEARVPGCLLAQIQRLTIAAKLPTREQRVWRITAAGGSSHGHSCSILRSRGTSQESAGHGRAARGGRGR